MKNVFQAIKALFVAFLPYLLHSHISFGPGGAPHVEFPPITDLGPLLDNLPALAGTLLTWYELVARLVPTTRNYSVFVLLGQLLQALVPNKAVLPDGEKGEFVAPPSLLQSCVTGVLHLFHRRSAPVPVVPVLAPNGSAA